MPIPSPIEKKRRSSKAAPAGLRSLFTAAVLISSILAALTAMCWLAAYTFDTAILWDLVGLGGTLLFVTVPITVICMVVMYRFDEEE